MKEIATKQILHKSLNLFSTAFELDHLRCTLTEENKWRKEKKKKIRVKRCIHATCNKFKAEALTHFCDTRILKILRYKGSHIYTLFVHSAKSHVF